MRTNFAIAALLYPMVQAVLFGLGLTSLLVAGASPGVYPVVIAATFVASLPIAFLIAPRLRSRAWRQGHGMGLKPS
jgi:hypothetical protein